MPEPRRQPPKTTTDHPSIRSKPRFAATPADQSDDLNRRAAACICRSIARQLTDLADHAHTAADTITRPNNHPSHTLSSP